MKPNLSRLTRFIDKPKQPSAEDILRGSSEPKMSAERKLGYQALAVLAARDNERIADCLAARDRATADAQKIEDAVWARIEARNRNAVG